VIKKGTKPGSALQVCWELNERNEKREIAGLVEACKSLDLASGAALMYDQERKLQIAGVSVLVLPVWRWLLLDNIPELSGGCDT